MHGASDYIKQIQIWLFLKMRMRQISWLHIQSPISISCWGTVTQTTVVVIIHVNEAFHSRIAKLPGKLLYGLGRDMW